MVFALMRSPKKSSMRPSFVEKACKNRQIGFNLMKRALKIGMLDPNEPYNALPELPPAPMVETTTVLKALLKPEVL